MGSGGCGSLGSWCLGWDRQRSQCATTTTASRSARDGRARRTEGPVEASKASERPGSDANASTTPWRADLTALETRLKTEFHASSERALPSTRTAISSADSELLQQVRALIRESERKQQNELALRIAEVIREFDSKRVPIS